MAVHVAGSAVARQALSSWGSPQHPLLAWWAASSASAGVGVLGVASAAAAAAFAASSSSDPHRDGRSNEAAATSSSSWRLWRQHLQHRRLPTAACEGAAVADGAPKIPATLRQRMTLIGRFSLESESPVNPSITSFVMALSGEPLTPSSLIRLWRDRQMSERHPRFLQTVSPHRPGYFEPSQKPLERYITEALYPARGGHNERRLDLRRRIQGMQTSPWDLGDALWHLYVAPWTEPLRPAFPPLSTSPSALPSESSGSTGVDGGETKVKENEKKLSYVLFRAHHALADGASFVAAMMDLFDEADDFRSQIAGAVRQRKRRAGSSWLDRLKRRVLRLLRFLQGSAAGIWYQCRLLLLTYLEPNPWDVVRKHHDATASRQPIAPQRPLSQSSSAPTTTAPIADRVVSFVDAAAPVDQVKWVARTLSGSKATVNDVFVSCITAALSRQLEQHRRRILGESPPVSSSPSPSSPPSSSSLKSQKGEEATASADLIPRQARVNISVPVHLSGGVILPGESLGNRLGAFVVRLPGEELLEPASASASPQARSTSEERLREVHRELLRMKRTSTPILSHLMAKGLSLAAHVLPSSWISFLYGRSHAGSTAVVTNVRGPPTAIHLGGRKVESFHGFVPLPPGVPVGVVVSSYDRRMTLTVTAEPWAVPDPDQFLAWVLEEYLTLLEAAVQRSRKK